MFVAPSSDHQGLQDQEVRKESVESRVTSRATRRARATLRAALRAALATAPSAETSTSAGSLRRWTTPTSPWRLQTTSRVSASKISLPYFFYLVNMQQMSSRLPQLWEYKNSLLWFMLWCVETSPDVRSETHNFFKPTLFVWVYNVSPELFTSVWRHECH